MNTLRKLLFVMVLVGFLSATTSAQVAPNLIFPQFADGEVNGVQNKTRIILRNNTTYSDSGKVCFFDATGSPVNVMINGIPIDCYQYSLEPWGSDDFETDGTGALKSGAVEVLSDLGSGSQIEASESFDLLGSFVSIPSTTPRASGQIYVSTGSQEQTGVA